MKIKQVLQNALTRIKIGNKKILCKSKKHKFWTVFTIFYFMFLTISLLNEYGK